MLLSNRSRLFFTTMIIFLMLQHNSDDKQKYLSEKYLNSENYSFTFSKHTSRVVATRDGIVFVSLAP